MIFARVAQSVSTRRVEQGAESEGHRNTLDTVVALSVAFFVKMKSDDERAEA